MQTDDEDRSLSLAEIREQEAVMSKRAYSGLSGSQIRWMAKRKPSASTSTKSFIPPSRVLQLRSIFKGLDFDGSGEISLEELKDAIKYVSSSNTGTGPPLIKDPDGIANLFQSMDIDGNGVVDFEEFLLGMTSAGDRGPSLTEVGALQNAFYDFANQHRRTMILDKMKDENVPVVERYAEFRKLYAIKFIKEEAGISAVTVEDVIRQAQRDAKIERGDLAAAGRELRQKEVLRSRVASISHKEKMRTVNPAREAPIPVPLKGYMGSSVPLLANKGAGVYRSRKQLQALGHSRTEEDLRRQEIAFQTEEVMATRLARNMSRFPLLAEDTYMPPLAVSRSSVQLAGLVAQEAVRLRAGKVDIVKDVLPAPASVRRAIVQRALDSDPHRDRQSHHHHHHHHEHHKGHLSHHFHQIHTHHHTHAEHHADRIGGMGTGLHVERNVSRPGDQNYRHHHRAALHGSAPSSADKMVLLEPSY